MLSGMSEEKQGGHWVVEVDRGRGKKEEMIVSSQNSSSQRGTHTLHPLLG